MIDYWYSVQNFDKKSNTVVFRPKGFPRKIDFSFPKGELIVCEFCKQRFNTKTHCRERERHNSLPWTDINLCITIDPRCLDQNRKLRKDIDFEAKNIPPQSYLLPTDNNFDWTVCIDCKERNFSKIYCRKKNHRKLPWKTTYFLITPSEMYQNSERPDLEKIRKTEPGAATHCEGNELLGRVDDTYTSIPESRTFLTILSSSKQKYIVSE